MNRCLFTIIFSMLMWNLQDTCACHDFCMTPDEDCYWTHYGDSDMNGNGYSQRSINSQSSQNRHEEIPVGLKHCAKTFVVNQSMISAFKLKPLHLVNPMQRLLLTFALSRIEESCEKPKKIYLQMCGILEVCAWKEYGNVIFDSVTQTFRAAQALTHREKK